VLVTFFLVSSLEAASSQRGVAVASDQAVVFLFLEELRQTALAVYSGALFGTGDQRRGDDYFGKWFGSCGKRKERK